MPYLTIIDEAHLDIIYARTKFFLWRERHRQGNEVWFTIDDIVAHFSQPPLKGIIVVALLIIEAGGELERRGNRVRHT